MKEIINIESEHTTRTCLVCGKIMNKGFVTPDAYFCSEQCLHTKYTPSEWEQLANDIDEDEEPIANDDFYWTVFED
jgi:endogenous inhibitor of DNA gyrase (YacG/DUF329 family)